MAATSRTLNFAGGSTNTITGAFNVNGSSGVLMTIGSTNTTPAILSAGSGLIFLDYLNISYLTFQGHSGWFRTSNSNDNGNNTGLIFMKNVQVNVVNIWKQAKAVQIQISGVWRTISKAQISIGGVWKSIF